MSINFHIDGKKRKLHIRKDFAENFPRIHKFLLLLLKITKQAKISLQNFLASAATTKKNRFHALINFVNENCCLFQSIKKYISIEQTSAMKRWASLRRSFRNSEYDLNKKKGKLWISVNVKLDKYLLIFLPEFFFNEFLHKKVTHWISSSLRILFESVECVECNGVLNLMFPKKKTAYKGMDFSISQIKKKKVSFIEIEKEK